MVPARPCPSSGTMPSPPSFQYGLSSRSDATAAARVASASRFICDDPFALRPTAESNPQGLTRTAYRSLITHEARASTSG